MPLLRNHVESRSGRSQACVGMECVGIDRFWVEWCGGCNNMTVSSCELAHTAVSALIGAHQPGEPQ